jgi:hypothetical protein
MSRKAMQRFKDKRYGTRLEGGSVVYSLRFWTRLRVVHGEKMRSESAEEHPLDGKPENKNESSLCIGGFGLRLFCLTDRGRGRPGNLAYG